MVKRQNITGNIHYSILTGFTSSALLTTSGVPSCDGGRKAFGLTWVLVTVTASTFGVVVLLCFLSRRFSSSNFPILSFSASCSLNTLSFSCFNLRISSS